MKKLNTYKVREQLALGDYKTYRLKAANSNEAKQKADARTMQGERVVSIRRVRRQTSK